MADTTPPWTAAPAAGPRRSRRLIAGLAAAAVAAGATVTALVVSNHSSPAVVLPPDTTARTLACTAQSPGALLAAETVGVLRNNDEEVLLVVRVPGLEESLDRAESQLLAFHAGKTDAQGYADSGYTWVASFGLAADGAPHVRGGDDTSARSYYYVTIGYGMAAQTATRTTVTRAPGFEVGVRFLDATAGETHNGHGMRSDVFAEVRGDSIIAAIPASGLSRLPLGRQWAFAAQVDESFASTTTGEEARMFGGTLCDTPVSAHTPGAPPQRVGQEQASTGAVPPVAPAPVPAADATGLFDNTLVDSGACGMWDSCTISSPSGNFLCIIAPTAASCFPPRGEPLVEGVELAAPGSGVRGPANGITVNAQGETEIFLMTAGTTDMATRADLATSTFPYGHQITAHGFTCAVDPDTGVSCRHDATRRGFSVTRQAYRFF